MRSDFDHALRLSRRLPGCQSVHERRCALRLFRVALFSALSLKRDGSHPLDFDRMVLEAGDAKE